MCGIIVSTEDIPLNSDNFLKNRGPDETNTIKYNNINFVHYLLHLTGEKTLQPLVENNKVCIFNGEIYNYKEILKDAKSDVYSIMKAYELHGYDFVKYLDGEFAIVFFDFDKNILIISGDIFKTKPLFYNINNDSIIISSYESCCYKIKHQKYNSIKPNETLVFDLNTREIIRKYKICVFDLNQHKTTYDDYIKAFEQSVLKRIPETSIPLVTLSSGLDSGAIACCLNKYNKKSLFMTINKNEDNNVIIKRNNILDNHVILNLSQDEKTYWSKYLKNNCEPCIWDWRYNPNVNKIDDAFNMGSMLGKCKIINETQKIDKNIKILFSGIGADEVMAHNSYYSCGYGNVDKFPNNLNDVFPWSNFFEGSMENYLRGDEYVGGCFSFETRYPFCDKNVVQEFLWLKPELKNLYNNSNYKPPLLYYLDKHKFPYCNRKLGFNV